MQTVNAKGLLPKASVLTKRQLDLIKRKKVLKSYADTAMRLIKQINDKLDPKIEEELKALGADKATVVVSGQAVEVQQFDRQSPRYKEIVDECLGAKILEKMLAATDTKGNPLYKTTSTTRRATVLGPATI